MSRRLADLINDAEATPKATHKHCWFKSYAEQVGEDAAAAADLLERKQQGRTTLTNGQIGKVLGEFAGRAPINYSTVAFCVRGLCASCQAGKPRL